MIRGARRLRGGTLDISRKNRTKSPNWTQYQLVFFPFRRGGAEQEQHYRVNKTDLWEESNWNSSTTSYPEYSHHEWVIEQRVSKKAFRYVWRDIFLNGVSRSLLDLKEWFKNPQAAAAPAVFGSYLSRVSELHDGGENTEALHRLRTSRVKTANLWKLMGQRF